MMRGCVGCRADQRTCEHCAPFWVGCVVYAVILLLALVVGCTGFAPPNGAYFTVTNRTADTIQLLLEDAPRWVERDGVSVRAVRVYPRGPIAPNKHQHFQWPFDAKQGRVVVVQRGDTTRSSLILPWQKRSWSWDIVPGGFVVAWVDR